MAKGIEIIEEFGTADVTCSDAELAAALRSGALDGVRELALGGKVTQLPDGLGRIKGLQQLVVYSTHMTALSATLFECEALELLGFEQRTKIATLPSGGWARLRALHTFDTAFLKISEFPADFGEATALRGPYDLRGLKKLTALPESFGALAGITELRVPPKFKTLPRSMRGMTSLATLDLTDSAVEALPSDLGELKRLTQLLAGKAKLKSLPESIGGCAALRELRVNGNTLSALPADVGLLANLQVLDVSENPLSTLPESVFGLKVRSIGLQGTLLDELPEGLTRMEHTRVVFANAQAAALRAKSPSVANALGARLQFW